MSASRADGPASGPAPGGGSFPMADTCVYCPDGHDKPTIKPWSVRVAPDRDSDGQPTHLIVSPSDCSHVAESDAEWLRALISQSGREQ